MPRKRKTEDAVDQDLTPRKTRKTAQDDSPSVNADTPSNRKSILKGTPSRGLNGMSLLEPTPKSLRKVLFSTPAEKAAAEDHGAGTPTTARNDRSARRKSAPTLQKAVVDESDEDDVGEAALAEAILDDEDQVDNDEDEDERDKITEDAAPPAIDTPTKRGRGRPKGHPKKERTPSPPPDLPPHELYFFQNRAGGNKTSNNTLGSNVLLNHEDYRASIKSYSDPHEADIKRLKDLHTRAFDQWIFELEEGFNLCLYGYGSKRDLVMSFADHIYKVSPKSPKIVVVNGYAPGLTLLNILTTLARATLPKTTKLPLTPAALLTTILDHLTTSPPHQPITLIIHSLDAPPLRKSPTPSLLARLASHESINLVATADNPNFPLLWPPAVLREYNWLYHDATTFQPYSAEIDVVEEVNSLLGRSGRRVGGKDGVAFVLKSLPENARNLFRILVVEQLSAMADLPADTTIGGDEADGDDGSLLGVSDDSDALAETPSRRQRKGRPEKKKTPKKKTLPKTGQVVEGVEYRTLYHKAVEEFVCSSELSFRTLLKEFHDHQMIESRKDGLGVERLVVPGMGRGELEELCVELV